MPFDHAAAQAAPAASVTAPDAPASRSHTLRLRIASALVLIAATLACLLLGGYAFAALVALAACVMLYEWDRLSVPRADALLTTIGAAALVPAILCMAAGAPVAGFAVLAAGMLALLASAKFCAVSPLWPVGGLLYAGLPALALVWLRTGPGGLCWTLWAFLLVWAVDIGAYVTGRRFGGPKLAPRISPGKTWSGLAGGVAAGGIVAGLSAWALQLGAPWLLVGFGCALAVLEQIGDLAESAFKRRWRVKDSGHWIPGHGGLLDRLDGLVAVAPIVALLVLVARTAS